MYCIGATAPAEVSKCVSESAMVLNMAALKERREREREGRKRGCTYKIKKTINR